MSWTQIYPTGVARCAIWDLGVDSWSFQSPPLRAKTFSENLTTSSGLPLNTDSRFIRKNKIKYPARRSFFKKQLMSIWWRCKVWNISCVDNFFCDQRVIWDDCYVMFTTACSNRPSWVGTFWQPMRFWSEYFNLKVMNYCFFPFSCNMCKIFNNINLVQLRYRRLLSVQVLPICHLFQYQSFVTTKITQTFSVGNFRCHSISQSHSSKLPNGRTAGLGADRLCYIPKQGWYHDDVDCTEVAWKKMWNEKRKRRVPRTGAVSCDSPWHRVVGHWRM